MFVRNRLAADVVLAHQVGGRGEGRAGRSNGGGGENGNYELVHLESLLVM